jgi:hypothetical protein
VAAAGAAARVHCQAQMGARGAVKPVGCCARAAVGPLARRKYATWTPGTPNRRADSQWGCGFFGIGMTVWMPAPVLAKKIRDPSGTSLPGAAVSQRNGQKTRAKGGDHSTSRVCGQMESKHNSGAHAT